MDKKTIRDIEVAGKTVLVRVDFNVPVKDGVITNDNRITAALPTIKYILEQGGRAILFSHLGRVKEEADKEGKSLAPVAADLAAKLGQDVKFIPGVTRGAELEAAGFDVVDQFDTIFIPDDDVLDQCYDLGKKLAQSLKDE